MGCFSHSSYHLSIKLSYKYFTLSRVYTSMYRRTSCPSTHYDTCTRSPPFNLHGKGIFILCFAQLSDVYTEIQIMEIFIMFWAKNKIQSTSSLNLLNIVMFCQSSNVVLVSHCDKINYLLNL